MTSLKYSTRQAGVAFTVASACLTFTLETFAQDPMDPALAPPTDTAATASVDAETSVSADTSATASAQAEVAPPEAPKAENEPEEKPSPEAIELAEKGAPMSPEPPPASTTATGTSVERETTVSLLGLESLPGSAYPSVQIRGLKYGSLWRTFHGQQWPYMPQIGDKPALRVGFSGYIWNDLSNARISADPSLAMANINDQNRWITQTRGIIRVTPTYNAGDDWFAQGNAEAVIQGDMRPDVVTGVTATTDDVWVRAGKWGLFDIQVGRFQGWEIANHFGMGLDWATLERQGAWITTANVQRPTDGYGLTYFWDRQNYLLGTYAVHIYPTEYLRAELLGHVGAGLNRATNPYQMDFRPAAIFDIGFLKVKAGFEYGVGVPQDSKNKTRDDRNGFGVAAQVVLAPYVEFGGSFARGYQDVADINGAVDFAASGSAQTFGGFLNASPGHEPLLIGFGAYWNHAEDLRWDAARGKVDTNDQQTMFGAVQYTLWEQLYIKFVLAHASNDVDHYNSGKYTNTSTSGRLRIEFLY